MTTIPTLTLNDANTMPQIGFGVWQIADDEAEGVLAHAFAAGYRHIDTAHAYANERGVGRAIAASGLPRDDLFIATKLWNDRHGYDTALRAFDESMERLGLDYLDLYLIHWPCPHEDKYADSWKAFVRLREEGRVRSIGVSNFDRDHLERIIGETGVTPAVNQVELHPRYQQRAARAHHTAMGIQIESWSPLGQGALADDAALQRIANKHGKTPAQVVLRWHVQEGLQIIPRSRTPAHIAQNIDIFDFALDASDMAAIIAMDDPNGKLGPVPADVRAQPLPIGR